MTREIKFRAWNPVTKQMEFKFMIPSTGKGYSGIMQSTGLKDKNGKEIYQSDQVRAKSNRTKKIVIGIVNWIEQEAAFRLVVESDYMYRLDDIHLSEIVGNEFENPELLSTKVGEQ